MNRAHVSTCLLLFVSSWSLLVGCHPEESTGPNAASPLKLEFLDNTHVQFDPSVGTTTVVVQFVARNGQSVPLEREDLVVELRINGNRVDVEGILQEDSEQLRTNTYLTLVLDASYSMLEQEPPAFGPMLSAARKTVTAGRTLYADRPGIFDWSLYWFNDRIYTPLETSSGTQWAESDIERIPAPRPGTFTKLYAAMEVAVTRSKDFAEQFANDARDQHMIVILSDGADNYSWFPNAEITGTGTAGTNRNYEYFGYRTTRQADLLALVRSHPSLKLNVIGLGSAVVDEDLRSLAKAGNGSYFKNPKSDQVDALFDRVALELTSIQTRGVTLPLPSGDYRLDVIVRQRGTGAKGTFSVAFHGGDAGAGPR